MTKEPVQVFFDATALVKVGAPPGNETFRRLVDLVRYGFITVFTTDLTMSEVARHHTDVAYETLRPLLNARFLRAASRYFSIEIPDMSEEDIRNGLKADISDGVAAMFSRLRTTVLDINEVLPSTIFDDYDQNKGFFVARNKKGQFPDAFTFERLKSVASPERPVLIVSDDPDFCPPVEGDEAFELMNSLEALFGELGLLVDEPDPDLEPFMDTELRGNIDFLTYVELDDESFDDYRATANCHTIYFESITAFRQLDEDAPILVSADVSVELDVELDYYDGTPSEVAAGTAKVSFYASIATNERGEPANITELRIYDCSLRWANLTMWYAL